MTRDKKSGPGELSLAGPDVVILLPERSIVALACTAVLSMLANFGRQCVHEKNRLQREYLFSKNSTSLVRESHSHRAMYAHPRVTQRDRGERYWLRHQNG